jgi:phage/plasmid-like protein (TIGR03299 family)
MMKTKPNTVATASKEGSHNLRNGVQIPADASTETVMAAAGLNWNVNLGRITAAEKEVDGYYAVLRSDTKDTLGVVQGRYKPIQNREVFDFADAIKNNSNAQASYDVAGALFGGRKVFATLSMPKAHFLGDDYQPYLFVYNSHDGSSSFKAGITNVRVVCTNRITAMLGKAKRVWAIRHSSNAGSRIKEAVNSLMLASTYQEAFGVWAESMAAVKVDAAKTIKLIFPYPPVATKKTIEGVEKIRGAVLRIAEKQDDLQNFRGTAFGVYQAVADWNSHREPRRKTPSYDQRHDKNFFVGDSLLEKTQKVLEHA